MVVYLDVLFFTNVLMDWITLLAAARLGGATVRQGRLALASLLGGLYAAERRKAERRACEYAHGQSGKQREQRRPCGIQAAEQ